jgi:hypothetical protein
MWIVLLLDREFKPDVAEMGMKYPESVEVRTRKVGRSCYADNVGGSYWISGKGPGTSSTNFVGEPVARYVGATPFSEPKR